MTPVIQALFALLFGLLIGSFLNVCIHRWPRGRSVVKPRSHCVRCRKFIPWYDNIPLVSYLLLLGRCRRCGARISPRYPLVEWLTGVLFFYMVHTHGFTMEALKMCVFCAILVALICCDMEKRILPDEFTLGGMVLGFLLAPFTTVPDMTAQSIVWLCGGQWKPWANSLAESALGAGLPAVCLWFAGWMYYRMRQKEGLGFGDVKLIAMVGSFVGLRGALLILIMGASAGSLLGYGYIKLTGKDTKTYELPLGSFLAAAALVAAIFSKWMLTAT